ncbi:MBL fold metallo-hydrolase [Leadbettera azotonutricia]|nr:MBL fold metallo-hydrolase [Leadbettera azotonutricia]
MKAIILGSGTSHGIPVVGCDCPVCRSDDPKDNRMRASLFVQGRGGESIIIDTGPEFRLQAIKAKIKKLDAIFLTHPHADHLHGLDDVRPLSREKPLPVYGNKSTIDEMTERFSYVFRETQLGGGKPRIEPAVVSEPVRIGALTIRPIPIKHGILDILGWHVSEGTAGAESAGPIPNGLLYLTDCSAIPQESVRLLPKPEILVIGGLRVKPHGTHFNFEQALMAGVELGAAKTYLTHICHEHSHKEIEDYCHEFCKKRENLNTETGPAWDGLTLSL